VSPLYRCLGSAPGDFRRATRRPKGQVPSLLSILAHIARPARGVCANRRLSCDGKWRCSLVSPICPRLGSAPGDFGQTMALPAVHLSRHSALGTKGVVRTGKLCCDSTEGGSWVSPLCRCLGSAPAELWRTCRLPDEHFPCPLPILAWAASWGLARLKNPARAVMCAGRRRAWRGRTPAALAPLTDHVMVSTLLLHRRK